MHSRPVPLVAAATVSPCPRPHPPQGLLTTLHIDAGGAQCTKHASFVAHGRTLPVLGMHCVGDGVVSFSRSSLRYHARGGHMRAEFRCGCASGCECECRSGFVLVDHQTCRSAAYMCMRVAVCKPLTCIAVCRFGPCCLSQQQFRAA
jgi:hypothetical protein